MQRLIWIVLAIAATVPALACGGSGDTPSAGPTPIPTAAPYAVEPQPTIISAGGAARATTVAEQAYVVVAGDTLSEIAQRFGTTTQTLIDRNQLTGPIVRIGQTLTIPGSGGGAHVQPPASATQGAGTAPGGGGNAAQVYVVEAGDTAWDIAAQFNVSVEALAAANVFTTAQMGAIRPGDRLNIPRPR
ncbi:MAG: LysM peptidoglycan-binding domain-containing protein [Dehalococcoidia bacterium]|nr:LysM peptidoglycan-binding domain-containing protein [Dehalococcoidia bacterium]